MEVKEYIDSDGVNHFSNFVASVKDKTLVRKINTRLVYLSLGNFGEHRNLPGGIGELKINYGPGIRVYFGKDGETLVILLLGNFKGKKRDQNADIERALDLWREYLERRKLNYE